MEELRNSLAQQGYRLADWSGIENVNAVFATNPYGARVVITLDKPKLRPKKLKQRFLISNEDTVKTETYDQVMTLVVDVTDVCMITKDGMCFVDDDGVTHYHHNHEQYPQTLSDRTVIYPVLKWKEIDSSPKAILENTDIIHSRLSAHKTKTVAQIMKDLDATVVNLNEKTTRTFELTHQALSHFLNDAPRLRADIIKEATNRPGSAEHQELQDLVQAREEHMAKLNDLYNRIQSSLVHLGELSDKLEAGNRLLEQTKLI